MIFCECPICDQEINLRGFQENEVIKCPECESELEIVSLRPAVLEEFLGDDDDDWDDNDDEGWDEQAEDAWKDKYNEGWDY